MCSTTVARDNQSSDSFSFKITVAQYEQWWNGVSAVLDLSNPKAVTWFKQELDRLQADYGVDGFKFGAGDVELIVRSAQVHALMPMMQFSMAPWRVLSPEELDAVLKSVMLREKFKDYILATAKASANSGEPIL